MIQANYQLVMLVRDNEGTLAWLSQDKIQDGALIEMLDLPDPGNLWTIRHISDKIISPEQYRELKKGAEKKT